MKRLLKTDHKSQTVTYLLVCTGIVLAFALTLIYPYTLSLTKMDREIDRIRSKIKEQKVLYPFYLDLQKKMKIPQPEGLLFPEKVTIASDETSLASSDFQRIAEQNQMSLQDVIPDVDSLISGSGYGTMNVIVHGDFFHIRNFLLQTGELPYLEKIERIQIQEMKDRPGLELRLDVAIAQKVKNK
jgi:hypothetical protein